MVKSERASAAENSAFVELFVFGGLVVYIIVVSLSRSLLLNF